MGRIGRTVAVAACMAGTVGLGATAAQAAWNPVASGGMDVSDQVSLARTSDNVLHVGWAAAGYDVRQTPITAAGAVGAPVPIASGWSSAGDPALVAQGTTLTAFFPGARTLDPTDPAIGLNMSTSTDAGASWALSPAAIYRGDFVEARTPAVVNSNGQWIQSFYGQRESLVHVGLSPAVPAQAGYGEGTDQGLAVDASGAVMSAWCKYLDPNPGVYAAPVDPATGAPAGPVTRMPGSGYCAAAVRTQVVARPGGGFYIAAENAERTKLQVWQPGATKVATLAGGSSTKQQVALTTTPEGRLWAGWQDSATGKLTFTRSNKTATKWGAAVAVAPPAGQSVYQLNMDGQRDRADVVVRTKDDSNTVSLSATQVRPGLTLQATSGDRPAFRVLDAGDPVAGATISVGSTSLTTNSQGRATANLAKGRYTAKAAKSGYVGASATVRAR